MNAATVYLYLWTIVAVGGIRTEYEWVPAGSFLTGGACHRAAANLNTPAARHRCIDITGSVR
ncbi:hypothetical protein [Leptothrix discophora]|uniref:Uncharacterized protein n=1 Tax=Leptothrix discophora TaxID=89 RepID=A0ABT9G2I0_LEPDI|nr:hypothetical protein [Leptothrix discophora]MDP4300378.1 hypothetical protein [Leptothrix discophora]